MGMTRSVQMLLASACVLLAEIYAPIHAPAADHLADLSGKADAFVTLREPGQFFERIPVRCDGPQPFRRSLRGRFLDPRPGSHHQYRRKGSRKLDGRVPPDPDGNHRPGWHDR